MADTCRLLAAIESAGAAGGRLSPEVSWLGLRADLIGDEIARDLARRSGRRSLYVLGADGPQGGGTADRERRIAAAGGWSDLVQLEYPHDLTEGVLAAVPPRRRWVAWRGPVRDLASGSIVEGLASLPSAVRCVEPWVTTPEEGLDVLTLLRHPRVRSSRGDWVIHARGPAGAWTRVLAPWLGSAFAVGRAGPEAGPSADGMLDVDQLRDHYGLPEVGPVTQVFGIVGPGALGSSAPALHNAGYRRAGLSALYLPFVSPTVPLDWVAPFASRFRERLGLSFGGLTVTAPHKEAAVCEAGQGASTPDAWATQAANNLAWHAGRWRADTDGLDSVLIPLLRRGIHPEGRRAAVVGCGGAGRAAALGLARLGAAVTLVNRGPQRGRWASLRLGLPFVPLDRFCPGRFDLLIHATPVGKSEPGALLDPERLTRDAVVLDMVYRADRPTELVDRARASGRVAVDGREVLATSVARQYELLTGQEIPPEGTTEAPDPSRCLRT